MVVKPLDASGGFGVFHVRRGDPNTGAILEQSTNLGRRWIMAQKYLPEVRRGDKRILLVDGVPLCAVLRVPAPDDARGNLHVGAKPMATKLDDRDQAIVRALGPWLRERGHFFVGLDVIGGWLTEVNVTSPTGILEANVLYDDAYEVKVLELLEQKIARRSRPDDPGASRARGVRGALRRRLWRLARGRGRRRRPTDVDALATRPRRAARAAGAGGRAPRFQAEPGRGSAGRARRRGAAAAALAGGRRRGDRRLSPPLLFEGDADTAAGTPFTPLSGGRLPFGGSVRVTEAYVAWAAYRGVPDRRPVRCASRSRSPARSTRAICACPSGPPFADAFLADYRVGAALGGDLGEIIYRGGRDEPRSGARQPAVRSRRAGRRPAGGGAARAGGPHALAARRVRSLVRLVPVRRRALGPLRHARRAPHAGPRSGVHGAVALASSSPPSICFRCATRTA